MKQDLLDRRSSGVLLHVTSLPGPHGSGDLGPAAHAFASFLANAGQRWWQMLPVGPTGSWGSPYDSPSAFAGSPRLIALAPLVAQGLLREDEVAAPKRLQSCREVDFSASTSFRKPRLRAAFERFERRRSLSLRRQFDAFRQDAGAWLDDYALYTALKQAQGDACWTAWPAGLRDRRAAELKRARASLAQEIRFIEFEQFQFQLQWEQLRRHCHRLGVRLLGDIPIYVAHDGADTWANRELFHLDRLGKRRVVAGVPPDMFSATGQLWGNPLYRWPVLARGGFRWWIQRFQTMLKRFDAVRLDHFIGFSRYWEVEAGARTAQHGRFVPVPGAAFLERAKEELGSLPMVAEDLGVVTPEVRSLRRRFELPGMNILQFAFGDPTQPSDYQPHRHERNSVVYTGTHDNDTTVGWFRERLSSSASSEQRAEGRRALDYADSDGRAPHWDMIRLALMSVANTAVFPMQDLLGLGSEARMNTPGTLDGNWTWRVRDKQLSSALAEHMAELCGRYERRTAIGSSQGRRRSR